MATTTTIRNRSKKLSPAQVEQRKRDAAVAMLQRNGIKPPKDDLRTVAKNAIFEAFEGKSVVRELIESVVDTHPETFKDWDADTFCELALTTATNGAAPVKSAAAEFHSRPDAKPIPKAEVCNFEPLTKWDLAKIEEAVDAAEWGEGWPENDSRWTLTPAEWRKQTRRGLTLRKQREKTK